MPLIQINAVGEHAAFAGAMPLERALDHHIAALPEYAPIVILVHGYKFSPFHHHCNPHDNILSMAPKARLGVVSWPRHLGFGRGRAAEGLCIGFGWMALGSFWKAHAEAKVAGRALAKLIELIGERTNRPVHLLAHSLGARVALRGMADAPARTVGRVVLMAAAEFRKPACRCLLMGAGRHAEVFNVTSRENDVIDALVEKLVYPLGGDRALGAGMPQASASWLDLQIDHAPTRMSLGDLGYRIAPPDRRICHWSGYLRPGLFGLYSDLLRTPERLPLAMLNTVLPKGHDKRWSRLLSGPISLSPRSFGKKTAT